MVSCDTCDESFTREDNVLGVHCDGCGEYHCRKCWSRHDCGALTDRNGKVVEIGNTIAYPGYNDRTYTVTEIPGTFKKVGLCYGDRLGRRVPREYHMVIRPRLMEVI